jgi:GNAT superfamily N-acetyltransferase
MENNNKTVQIINYNPSHHEAFKKINIDWIADKFVVEDVDVEVLDNPDKYILNNGGHIFMAEYDNKLVGTCSLTNEGNGTYELTKMGVDKNYRGLKIGFLLGEATVNKAKELGAKKLILHSNREGSAAAIELYKKLGFVEVPMGNVQWKRANIQMEIEF